MEEEQNSTHEMEIEEFKKDLKVNTSTVMRWVGIRKKITFHVSFLIAMAIIIGLLSALTVTVEHLGYIMHGVQLVIVLAIISFFGFIIKIAIDLRLYQRIKSGKYSIKLTTVNRITSKRVIDDQNDKSESRLELKCGNYLIKENQINDFKPGDLVAVVEMPGRKYPLAIENAKRFVKQYDEA